MALITAPTYITHEEADALKAALATMRAENQALSEKIAQYQVTASQTIAGFHETRERADALERRVEEASRSIRSGIFSAVATAFAVAVRSAKVSAK